MIKNNKKTMKTIVFSLVLAALTLTANNLNAQDRGLFGMGKSSADNNYSTSQSLMSKGSPVEINDEGGISNYGIGEEVPMGSGLLILSLAGAGYAALRRKRSRKGTALLLACVMLLGFTQCKKEQVPTNNENEGVRITLTVDGGNNGSRVIVNPNAPEGYATVTFESGDIIYVGNNGAYVGYLTYDGTNFSGSIDDSNLNEADYLHFYFMGNKGTTSQPTTVSITDQTSKYPVISYAHSTKLYKSGVTSYTAKLQNYCAIVKFTTNNIPTATAITVKGMQNTVSVDFAANNKATGVSGNPYTPGQSGEGDITLHAVSPAERWAILLEQDAVNGAVVTASGYNDGTCDVPVVTNNMYYTTGVEVSLSAAAAVGHALSVSVLGEVVGTDGLAYAVADKDNLPTGVTAAGMVAYKDGSNGLVIALTDEASPMDWNTANGTTGAAAHTPTVSGQAWKLPSAYDLDYMITAFGNYTVLNTAIVNAGGIALPENIYYWTSTLYYDDRYLNVYLYDGSAQYSYNPMDWPLKVRACFAF